jgi:hypothetical protein
MPAEKLAAVYAMSPVANERFTGMVNGTDGVTHSQSGWDPYEVWRTRLKRPSVATQENLLQMKVAATEQADETDDDQIDRDDIVQ